MKFKKNIINLVKHQDFQNIEYRKLFLKSIKKMGIDIDVYNLSKEVLDEKILDLDMFFSNLKKKSKNDHLINKIIKFESFCKKKIKFNSTCYYRSTAEDTRVKQWPNNQKIKKNEPNHFFNIYEDHFYRYQKNWITKNTAVGSAGSCFALRIAHQLQRWGYNYVIEEDDLPIDFPIENLHNTNYRMAPARVGTLYNVPSMRQMVERAFGEYEPSNLYINDNGKIRDPFRSIKNTFKNDDQYLLDQFNHTKALKRALLKCDVFFFTLGLTEAWKFIGTDEYISVSPWKVDPLLIEKENISLKKNIEELSRLVKTYLKYKPDIKIILTLSPIPLNKTFEINKHVVEASNFSKSVLRCAIDEVEKLFPNTVSYFPAFETVIYGTKDPWEVDMRHVSNEAVKRVMDLFVLQYCVNKKLSSTIRFEGEKKTKFPSIKGVIKKILRL